MRREMEREFQDMFRDIETKAPKDLVREYETKEGDKVKEYGPFVYGYSLTVGPDGRPKVREFGNFRSPFSSAGLFTSKENIQIKSYDHSVEVTTTGPRKYREVNRY